MEQNRRPRNKPLNNAQQIFVKGAKVLSGEKTFFQQIVLHKWITTHKK